MKKTFLGYPIQYLLSVDSTNKYLKNINLDKVTKCVVSETQTEGKGQGSNKWHDQPGQNILMSIMIEWGIDTQDAFWINILISNALHRCIKNFLEDQKIDFDSLKIKWPNDIYLNAKKIGGILIENTIRGTKIENAIIGIGINVNQIDFPVDISTRATSIAAFNFNNTVDKVILRDQMIESLENLSLKHTSLDRDAEQLYYTTNMLGFGIKLCYYNLSGKIFTGQIVDVDRSGKLIMKTSIGLQSYDFKEIKWLI